MKRRGGSGWGGEGTFLVAASLQVESTPTEAMLEPGSVHLYLFFK